MFIVLVYLLNDIYHKVPTRALIASAQKACKYMKKNAHLQIFTNKDVPKLQKKCAFALCTC